MAELWIANTVRDLIQGDVLRLGTTTSPVMAAFVVDLAGMGAQEGRPLQELVAQAIGPLRANGTLPGAPTGE